MRALVLTHRLPFAPNKGDRLRAFHVLRSLAGRMEIDLVSFVHDADEARRADQVPGAGEVHVVQVPRSPQSRQGADFAHGRHSC